MSLTPSEMAMKRMAKSLEDIADSVALIEEKMKIQDTKDLRHDVKRDVLKLVKKELDLK